MFAVRVNDLGQSFVQEIVAHFVGLNLHNNQCPKMAIPID
jgi:hypothetical protein